MISVENKVLLSLSIYSPQRYRFPRKTNIPAAGNQPVQGPGTQILLSSWTSHCLQPRKEVYWGHKHNGPFRMTQPHGPSPSCQVGPDCPCESRMGLSSNSSPSGRSLPWVPASPETLDTDAAEQRVWTLGSACLDVRQSSGSLPLWAWNCQMELSKPLFTVKIWNMCKMPSRELNTMLNKW